LTPQSQKERERKEEGERLETYTETHGDRRCQLRKDMAQNIVRLDEGEEEESEIVTIKFFFGTLSVQKD
jgi:hypothetical protein